MVRGHTRGTSYSKKRYDKLHQRNYYAKDLLEGKKYAPRIVETKEHKPTKKELQELADDQEDQDKL